MNDRMNESRDPLSTALLIGLVRAAPVIVLGCIYLWMRESLRAKLGGALDWFAPPLFLVTASYIVARTVIRRRTLLPASRRGAIDQDEPGSSFDPDAALQRYLDNKGPAGPMQPKPNAPRSAPRGGFGRKGA